jgi:hypothetical protein
MTPVSENLTAALNLAAQGIYVFPALASWNDESKKLEKKPAIDGWQERATTDASQIKAWFTTNFPAALPGIELGRSNLFVVDLDQHHGGADGIKNFKEFRGENPAPQCPTVRTPSGGFHLYFRQPDGERLTNRTGTFPAGIDCRGNGGWTVGPGAVFGPWQWVGNARKIAAAGPVPGWILEAVKARKNEYSAGPVSTDVGKRERAYAETALSNAANQVAAATPGRRNSELNTAAFCMGKMVARGWIGAATVEGRLHDAATACGLLGNEVRGTIKSGLEAGSKEPHADLPERSPPTSRNGATTWQADSNPAHDWSDPDWSLLDDRRGELPEFPLHVLSPKMQALIKRTAKGAGVTPAHVAVPMLGIISSLIGIARRVEATTSWRQPMTCWTTVVGFSGTGKTPGLNVTKRCVKQVERDNKDSDDAKRRAHETKKEGAAAARAKWKKALEEAIQANLPPPPMPIEATDPGKFIPPKLYVSDGTIERLGELLQARPQGILYLRDELSGLFTNMSRYSNGQDNEFWLEAWNGDSFNVERMGRVTHVDHLLIGIVGGMQPDKLVKSFEGDHDGMYARVLYSWPSEWWCDLTDEAGELEPDIQNIIGRVNKLGEVTPEGALVIRNIPLSPEAREEFAQFRQYEHEGKNAFEGREREWWAKMPAHVLRLAGVLTYLPWAMEGGSEPASIDKSAMSSAIILVRDYFWPHARACLRQIGLTERHTQARRVLRWLKANRRTEVSREDVRREALAQQLDADQTTALLTSLCNSGWLRETIFPSGPRGGKPARRWRVNPLLFKPPIAQTAETPSGVG